MAKASSSDMSGHISATAFLVNESRARRVEISGDVYAEHWVPPEERAAVRQLWDDFSATVYQYDDLELSIRNRFFLERLQQFVTAHADAIFVNVGAGFTSYPFLLERPVHSLEVDFPQVVGFKQQRLEQLRAARVLDDRAVGFLGLDLQDADGQQRLRKALEAEAAGKPSFILLEGVTYYLARPALETLIGVFREVQPTGSLLAFDFWKPDITQRELFRRMQQFFAERFAYHEQAYNFFGEQFIEGIDGYRTLLTTDVAEQEATYARDSHVLQDNLAEILPENYAVLQRHA